MHISQYMNPALVVFFEAYTRDDALEFMVNHISQQLSLKDEDVFLQAIKNREKIVSTGIGMGIAIPHAKLAAYDQFFITIGILKTAIDWNALDKAPVRLIFMIGGPDDKPMEYLQLLSNLTHALKEEDLRQNLLTLQNARAIVELF